MDISSDYLTLNCATRYSATDMFQQFPYCKLSKSANYSENIAVELVLVLTFQGEGRRYKLLALVEGGGIHVFFYIRKCKFGFSLEVS